MAVIESLRTAVDALSRNRVLFLAGLGYGLLLLPQNALRLARVPLAPTAVSALSFFLTPFVVAGLLGMADESIDGDTSLSTMVSVGRDRYVPLLLGNLVRFGIHVVFAVVAIVVLVALLFTTGFASAVATGGFTPGAVGAAVLLPAVAVLALLALLFLLVTLFIQFYDVAIVVDEVGATDGFVRSVGFVRDNFLGTVGYSIVNLTVAIVVNLPVAGYVALRSVSESGTSAGASVPTDVAQLGPGAFGGGPRRSRRRRSSDSRWHRC
ncbi:hypothetical protein ACFQJD_05335 [Haloplanus sp. GCM10025708]|uniref:DUF7847 domain-containing protein n=1 Tax=Haloplanus sp. GCM10025708 TaxID=3252679 RepID=UPI00361EFB13